MISKKEGSKSYGRERIQREKAGGKKSEYNTGSCGEPHPANPP